MPLECRSCGFRDSSVFLSLGDSPLANRLLTQEELGLPEPRYPLNLAFCRNCSLVQLTDSISPEDLFSEYPYFSSFSDTMLSHVKELTNQITKDRSLDSESLVIEIASNDGYLLRCYRDLAIPVLGIEPAENIAKVANDRAIPTLVEFFGKDLARQLRAEGRTADVVHAHNVFAHVPDLNGFVQGVRDVLKPDGIAVIEVPYVRDLIERVEFDTIYHEHLSYFSLTAVDALVRRHGLRILDALRVSIHGGSLRITLGLESYASLASPRVEAMLEDERRLAMTQEDYYQGFSRLVDTLRSDLVRLIQELKRDNNQIAAYGASAKGTTLLSYCGISNDELDFVVDRSTVKQGRFTPGSHLPIRGTEALLEAMPDYVLLLVWNFKEEVLKQQSEYRRRNGKFIMPVPTVEVV